MIWSYVTFFTETNRVESKDLQHRNHLKENTQTTTTKQINKENNKK